MSLEIDSTGTVQAYVHGTSDAPAAGATQAGALQPAIVEDPLWYKDAVIYQVHVKSFFDTTNDGVGDFSGLIDKLDYIASLGVTAIWLFPSGGSPRNYRSNTWVPMTR